MRDIDSGPAVAELKEVKIVYLEVGGSDTAFNTLFLSNLRSHFQGKTQLSISENRNEADTLLKVTVENRVAAHGATAETLLKRRITGTVRLINADGHTIWPNPKGGRFSGTAEEISRRIAANLVESIEKAKTKT